MCDRMFVGVAGKSFFNLGGGSNYLCLPLDPESPGGAEPGEQIGAQLYGVEYEGNAHSPLHLLHNQEVPCAVCDASAARPDLLMIPARLTCPDGWLLEYDGYLASQHYTEQTAEFICLSFGMEATRGSNASNVNGGTLYVVEAVCGALPCPPYVGGNEIACAVCTK